MYGPNPNGYKPKHDPGPSTDTPGNEPMYDKKTGEPVMFIPMGSSWVFHRQIGGKWVMQPRPEHIPEPPPMKLPPMRSVPPYMRWGPPSMRSGPLSMGTYARPRIYTPPIQQFTPPPNRPKDTCSSSEETTSEESSSDSEETTSEETSSE